VTLPGNHDRRQRRILIGLALMFFAPLGLSFYLYYGKEWHPGGRVNAGELIEPPRPLPAVALPLASGNAGQTQPQLLKGKWTLLYVQHGRCDDECAKRLYDTRQVRLALDREMNRVQRVFVAGADCCDLKEMQAAHPDLIMIRASAADEPVLALLPAPAGAVNSQRVYLIDPLSNVMMFYGPGSTAKGMLEDLKRLLRLSSIG
jgi:cytochrome oxidase Cu insertion factor (SCO1/SenC/PrrC family)